MGEGFNEHPVNLMLDVPLNDSVKLVAPLAEWSARFTGWGFLQVRNGSGYLLSPAPARELSAGDTAIVAPGVGLTLRASQLTELNLECFEVNPSQLGGILTIPERAWLERHALDARQPVRVVTARKLTELGLHGPEGKNGSVHSPFVQRFERLHFAARLLDADLPSMIDPAEAGLRQDGSDCVGDVFTTLTEKELCRMTAGELAQRCGCSQRHFRRLFQKRFGTTLRSQLTQLRLEHARRLLRESDDKIVNVAMDSGFRNLSLFNVLFKRHFGLTPSAWRLQSRDRCHRVVA